MKSRNYLGHRISIHRAENSELIRRQIFAAGRESKIEFVAAAAHDHNHHVR
jgi:hypothetical protein